MYMTQGCILSALLWNRIDWQHLVCTWFRHHTTMQEFDNRKFTQNMHVRELYWINTNLHHVHETCKPINFNTLTALSSLVGRSSRILRSTLNKRLASIICFSVQPSRYGRNISAVTPMLEVAAYMYKKHLQYIWVFVHKVRDSLSLNKNNVLSEFGIHPHWFPSYYNFYKQNFSLHHVQTWRNYESKS